MTQPLTISTHNKPLAVITGAASPGYGQAITRKFLDMGFTVIGTYQPDQSGYIQHFATEQSLNLQEVDLADRDQLLNFTKLINGKIISALIHGQMFFNMENPDDFDHTTWDRSIAINLTAPNFLTHELKSQISDGGSIVSVTSTEGFIGSFGATAYAATKAAMHNLTKSLANNLGKRRIRVNCVAAGWIGGVMDTDEVFNMSRRITPLERLGSADEIANVVAFLCSNEASFVNGQVIIADGGYTGVDTISKYEFEASRKQNSK